MMEARGPDIGDCKHGSEAFAVSAGAEAAQKLTRFRSEVALGILCCRARDKLRTTGNTTGTIQ